MKGPYKFPMFKIDSNLLGGAGTYILVNVNNNAIYVGRSDSNLNNRLKDHLPQNEANICINRCGVDAFYFEITRSTKEAYNLECEWYHRYTPTCNNAHPLKKNLGWHCPICGL